MASQKERFDVLVQRQAKADQSDGMETVQLFLALAEEGYAPAQTKAACFLAALGKPAEGRSMLEKACEQKDPRALTAMGARYHSGCAEFKLEQSFDKAFSLYEQAAALGDSDAILNLGHCYSDGEGCERNYQKAAQCYRRLTFPGEEDKDACFHLSCLCLQGHLGNSDRLKAEGMVNIQEAASRGHQGAIELQKAFRGT